MNIIKEKIELINTKKEITRYINEQRSILNEEEIEVLTAFTSLINQSIKNPRHGTEAFTYNVYKLISK